MCVFELLILSTDTASYDGRHPHKIMSQHERSKKEKYIEACLERRRHFMPLVFSVEGVMGEERKEATEQLTDVLSKKWYMEYLETFGYTRARLSVNLVCAFSFLVYHNFLLFGIHTKLFGIFHRTGSIYSAPCYLYMYEKP